MHGVQLNNIVVIHIDLCGLLLSSKHTEQSRQSPIQHCVWIVWGERNGNTTEDWPISGAMFYTGLTSLAGSGSGCAFRCTSVDTTWSGIADRFLPTCLSSIDSHRHLRSAICGQLQIRMSYKKRAFGHFCRSIHWKRSFRPFSNTAHTRCFRLDDT